MKYLIMAAECSRCGETAYASGPGEEPEGIVTRSWTWGGTEREIELCKACDESVELLSVQELLALGQDAPVAGRRKPGRPKQKRGGSTGHLHGPCPYGCKDGKEYKRLDSHLLLVHEGVAA